MKLERLYKSGILKENGRIVLQDAEVGGEGMTTWMYASLHLPQTPDAGNGFIRGWGFLQDDSNRTQDCRSIAKFKLCRSGREVVSRRLVEIVE